MLASAGSLACVRILCARSALACSAASLSQSVIDIALECSRSVRKKASAKPSSCSSSALTDSNPATSRSASPLYLLTRAYMRIPFRSDIAGRSEYVPACGPGQDPGGGLLVVDGLRARAHAQQRLEALLALGAGDPGAHGDALVLGAGGVHPREGRRLHPTAGPPGPPPRPPAPADPSRRARA